MGADRTADAKLGRMGRPREIEFREVINAVRYLVRSGCGWRMLPIHFGHWRTVYGWFRELARRFLFQTIHDVELMLDRERSGREASRSAGVIDSQSIKAPNAKTRGYDAGKKIVGRKRHIAVDTDGRLLMVNLTLADISDSAGVQTILDAIRKRWPWVKHLFADCAYDRFELMDKAAYLEFVIEIIRRRDELGALRLCPAMSRRAALRLDDPMVKPRARLRAPHRRLTDHNPRRHERQSHPSKRSPMTFQTGSEHSLQQNPLKLKLYPPRHTASQPARRSLFT